MFPSSFHNMMIFEILVASFPIGPILSKVPNEAISVVVDESTKPLSKAHVCLSIVLHPRVLTMGKVEVSKGASCFHLRVVVDLHCTMHRIAHKVAFNEYPT